MPKKILLIDVSHLFFRAFFAIPRNLTGPEGEPINAIFGVSSMILSLLESERPDYVFGAKDEKGKTKRHEELEEYKGHRPEMPPELVSQLPKIFDIFSSFHIPLCSLAGFEADDMIATIAEKYRQKPEFSVEIVSGDHDLFQLVGDNVKVALPQIGGKAPLLLDRVGVFEKMGVYPEQVCDYKSLVGDPSDNFKGVDGIGKKTGAKLLQEFGTLENLFAHLEEIPGKLQEKLRNGRDQAAFLKRIATLHCDVPLPEFSLEKGDIQNIDFPSLEIFLRKYQFHSLLNRLPKLKSRLTNTPVSEHEEFWEELETLKSKKLGRAAESQEKSPQMPLF